MRKFNQYIWLILTLLALNLPAFGEVPQLINYQGRLTNPAGDPVADGQYNVTFRIWRHPTIIFVTYIEWESGPHIIDVADGLFTWMLGSETAFAEDLFVENPACYLGITVEGDPEIMPRPRLAAVPYSLYSETTDRVTGGPGIAYADDRAGVLITLSDTTNLLTRSIDVPGPGFVVVHGVAYAWVQGEEIGNIVMSISHVTGQIDVDNLTKFGANNESVPVATYRFGTLSTMDVYEVYSGNYNFYLTATRTFNGGTAYIFNRKLLLTYYPTAYGTVGK